MTICSCCEIEVKVSVNHSRSNKIKVCPTCGYPTGEATLDKFKRQHKVIALFVIPLAIIAMILFFINTRAFILYFISVFLIIIPLTAKILIKYGMLVTPDRRLYKQYQKNIYAKRELENYGIDKTNMTAKSFNLHSYIDAATGCIYLYSAKYVLLGGHEWIVNDHYDIAINGNSRSLSL